MAKSVMLKQTSGLSDSSSEMGSGMASQSDRTIAVRAFLGMRANRIVRRLSNGRVFGRWVYGGSAGVAKHPSAAACQY
jgi:hypothetical protein